MDAGLVADEADATVAVRDQVRDAVTRAAEAVGQDHVRVDLPGGTVDEHGRDTGGDLGLQVTVVVVSPG